jgi:general nucleoside transport system permease protein
VKARRALLALLAPLSAIVLALVITSIVLAAIGENPFVRLRQMIAYGTQPDSLVSMVNRAVPLYLSGLAVAIGFKMNLFNIGVDGQFRMAALLAAAAGGAVNLPAPLHIALILVVAMGVGAAWAGVAGVLKVKRGVHEVISTIMLNLIATGLTAYLLANYLRIPQSGSQLLIQTPHIPPSGQLPPLATVNGEQLFSFVVVAVVVGIAFYLLVWRTRFGYDLRATGVNPEAARVSGIHPGSMVIRTMLISGGIAGLVGMSDLLGFFHAYTLDFPATYGFAGIAVALVGRNHPVGIALGALLFGFLDRSSQILDLERVPKEIITIMTGVIILTVVIAYEVVRRLVQAQELRAAAEATRPSGAEPAEAPA